MALKREDFGEEISDIELLVNTDFLTSLVEEHLDAILQDKFEGKKVIINIEVNDDEEMLVELKKRYSVAGWKTKINAEEFVLTLF